MAAVEKITPEQRRETSRKAYQEGLAKLTPEQRDANARKGGLAHGSGESHPRWKGDDIGYTGAHMRVRALRGPATEYPCDRCGRYHDKMEWAYNGEDPNEKIEREGAPGAGCAYSTDPSFYVPLCGDQCHILVDVARGGRGWLSS